MHIVLSDELKKGPITKHLSHFKLVLIPVLSEARLDITLMHLVAPPVNPGTPLAYKDAKRHIEVSALLFATLDAVGVVGVLHKELLDQLGLLRWLALERGLWWRDLGRRDQFEEGVRRERVMRLLLEGWCPSWTMVRREFVLVLRFGIRGVGV